MTSQSCIEISQEPSGVVSLRMDEPETRNGLSERLCAMLEETLARLATDSAARVVVLKGTREVFCSGATFDTLEKAARGNLEIRELQLPSRILGFPLPVLAAVEGAAVGGGLVLAICADVTVAAEGQRYGFNFTDLGFTPGMGSTGLVPQLVGDGFAAEMLMTAKYYRGRELAGRGLFTHVVPGPEVESLTMDLARRMAEKPRRVLQLLKEALALPRLQRLQLVGSRERLMHQISFADPAVKQRIEERYVKPAALDVNSGRPHHES